MSLSLLMTNMSTNWSFLRVSSSTSATRRLDDLLRVELLPWRDIVDQRSERHDRLSKRRIEDGVRTKSWTSYMIVLSSSTLSLSVTLNSKGIQRYTCPKSSAIQIQVYFLVKVKRRESLVRPLQEMNRSRYIIGTFTVNTMIQRWWKQLFRQIFPSLLWLLRRPNS